MTHNDGGRLGIVKAPRFVTDFEDGMMSVAPSDVEIALWVSGRSSSILSRSFPPKIPILRFLVLTGNEVARLVWLLSFSHEEWA